MFRPTQTQRQLIILASIGVITSAGMFVAFWYIAAQSSCYPCLTVGKETLNMNSYQFDTSTNLTLTIRNTGADTIGLATYVVMDSSHNQYNSPGWSGPTLPVNAVTSVSIIISGQSFSFQPGNNYIVQLVSTRNNWFTFQCDYR